jgi:hypothetical protein
VVVLRGEGTGHGWCRLVPQDPVGGLLQLDYLALRTGKQGWVNAGPTQGWCVWGGGDCAGWGGVGTTC